MNIIFDKQESDERTNSGWNWFYGTVEANGKKYPFSLCEMNTKVGGQNTTAIEITWIEQTPPCFKDVENKVEQVFEEEF